MILDPRPFFRHLSPISRPPFSDSPDYLSLPYPISSGVNVPELVFVEFLSKLPSCDRGSRPRRRHSKDIGILQTS